MAIEELKNIVGPRGWTTDPVDLVPHLSERRRALTGKTAIMLSPDSTEQVSAIVAACAAAGLGVVPQGGNTGLCGGAIPDQSGDQVLLSLSRLNRIRAIEPDNFSITVEAGCTLATVQQAASDAGRLFPLSLASEGSCQIGGNLATDAGGINVLRYGTARQQVLGLEVVLADGRIWNGLRALRKDTGGYNLKQVFIGSEGTLGIITAATLRLYAAHADSSTALVALASSTDAVKLLSAVQSACGDQVVAFELMAATAFDFAVRYLGNPVRPFSEPHPWYALIDVATSGGNSSLLAALNEQSAAGLLQDAVVAKSGAEAQGLWRFRHAISDAQRAEGVSIKHDISVPIGQIDEFMQRAQKAVHERLPGVRIVAFGHLGDGNLHYNLSQPPDMDGEAFRAEAGAASAAIYDLVAELGGSFSAEHGVGVLKKPLLQQYRSSVELELMRKLKQALDPANTLNPGKVM